MCKGFVQNIAPIKAQNIKFVLDICENDMTLYVYIYTAFIITLKEYSFKIKIQQVVKDSCRNYL